MRNVSNRNCTENQNMCLYSITFFSENCAIYEIISEKYGAAREAADCTMEALCLLDKEGYTSESSRPRPHPTHTRTHTHARTHAKKHAIRIAFPMQQWFRERAAVLRYTHIACLVNLFHSAS